MDTEIEIGTGIRKKLKDFLLNPLSYMSPIVRKPEFCLCENKGTDQLRSNCEADQRLCFHYTDSTISLLLKCEISSFWPASVTVQVSLCQTWSETPKTSFLASRLICNDCMNCFVCVSCYLCKYIQQMKV